jgi:hypothetical protein
MKKITRTVAVILVLVMLATSFTGCMSTWLMTGEMPNWGSGSGDGYELIGYLFLFAVDVALLPIALIVCIVREGREAARRNRGDKIDGIDTFSAAAEALPKAELDSLMKKFYSMPSSELADLMKVFNSMPEAEIDSFAETLNSFSEKEFSVLVSAVNNLSPEQIASSIETLNSMPEESFISTMKDLQNIEFRYQYVRREQ